MSLSSKDVYLLPINHLIEISNDQPQKEFVEYDVLGLDDPLDSGTWKR